jgi:hypothetical protein
MKIFEILWLVAAVIAITIAILRGLKGETYGNYLYIAVFTSAISLFMYRFKKKNRLFLEERQKRKQNSSSN